MQAMKSCLEASHSASFRSVSTTVDVAAAAVHWRRQVFVNAGKKQ